MLKAFAPHIRLSAAVLLVSAGTLAGGCSQFRGRTMGAVMSDANIAYENGDYATASVYYREWLDRRPGAAEAQYRLGRSYLEIGDAGLARESMTIALDLDPDNTKYRDGLVQALVANGEIDAVYALLDQRAGEMDGPEAYLKLGDATRKAGLADDAERAYKLAVSLGDREWPDGHRALAEMYRDLGDTVHETERLKVLYYLNPNDEDVVARLRELGEIPGPTLGLSPEMVSNEP